MKKGGIKNFANMILEAKNKKIKGKEHKMGSTFLGKDGKYKVSKKGRSLKSRSNLNNSRNSSRKGSRERA